MKKLLLLSLLLVISPFCFANAQQIDKAALQSIKTELIDQMQKIEEDFKGIATQYGDLCIVPMKIANEFRSHDVVKKMEKRLITLFVSQVIEEGSINFGTEEWLEISSDEKDREQGCALFEEIKKKYEEEGNQIYRSLLERCRNNDPDISEKQCNMVHTSQCDLVNLYLTMYCGREVALGVLREIEALL